MFILIRDDESHWYVIPADKEDDWYDWLDDLLDEDDVPEWAVPVGGGPTLVKFDTYVIGDTL